MNRSHRDEEPTVSEVTIKSDDPSASEQHPGIERRLRALLARSEQQIVELESSVTDHDTIQEDRNNLRMLIEAIRADALKARRALTRLEDGMYGHCTSCGEQIADERLQAIPTVEHCGRCA